MQMNNEKTDLELIDQFIAGTLDSEARIMFETRLKTDENLKQEMLAAKNVIEGIRASAFKKKLQLLHLQFEQSDQKPKRIGLYYITGIAASLIFVVGIVFYSLQYADHGSYYSYFKPYPSSVNVRSDVNPSWDKAMDYYDREKYNEAITFFNKIPSGYYSEEMQFYHAVSYLANDQPDAAVTVLRKLKSIEYREPVTWYLGLAYLLTKNRNEAKKVFEQIQPGDYGYEDAQSILKSIP
jgi:hypothetical protein